MLRKRKNLIIVLIAFTLVKIGIHFPLRDVSGEILKMSKYYEKLKNEATVLSQFEDSVIFGNSSYKKQILDSISSVIDLKDFIAKNNQDLQEKIKELELFSINEQRIERKYWIYNSIDDFANVILVVSLLFLGIAVSRNY